MTDIIDVAANHLQSLKNALKLFKHQVSAPNAATSLPKLIKLRSQYTEVENKFTKMISSLTNSSKELETLKKDHKQVHDEFVRVDRVFQNLKKSASSSTSAQQQQQPLTDSQLQQAQVRKYDTAALDTEQEYQRQRLQGIIDIEQSANEVRGMFKDFNTMVHSQQGGLDLTEKNIDKATGHVSKGADQIRKARNV